MTIKSNVKAHLIRACCYAVFLGGRYLNHHYQRLHREASERSDHDLFDWVEANPPHHLKYWVAAAELLKRGYTVSDIRLSG
ncbi:hypothetical protein KW477_11920 [Vibrio fluvialis]|nr:hypothetical protein [Vibrio fluvialis]